jgi:hypothetical protein
MRLLSKLLPVALLSVSVIGFANASQARVIDEIGSGRPVFKNGGTIIPANAQSACVGDIVKYETRYQNLAYKGTMWLKTSDGRGCNNDLLPKRLTAYFEERNANNWCRGDVSLTLRAVPLGGGRWDSTGSVIKWTKIEAVPGFACPGAGQKPELTLRYVPLFQR